LNCETAKLRGSDMNVDTAVARLKRHRAWAERAQTPAASDPRLAADTERTIELAELLFQEKIMDAEGVSKTKH
jgi:hypothetical protein